jgi:hypothetical protein
LARVELCPEAAIPSNFKWPAGLLSFTRSGPQEQSPRKSTGGCASRLFLGSAVVWTIQWDELLEMAANRMLSRPRSISAAFACVRGQYRSEFSDNTV